MLKRFKAPTHQPLAESAAKEVAPYNGVGSFISSKQEGPGLTSYLFESRMRGYKGWNWNVIIFQGKKSDAPTISEVLLEPGEAAIIAPDWVPWSDRTVPAEELLDELVVLDLEESVDPEKNSDDAGGRPPITLRLRKRRVKNQNNDKSKSPKTRSKNDSDSAV